MDAKEKKRVKGITILVALIYMGILVGWHIYTPRGDLSMQLPGADNRPEALERKADDVLIGEYFMEYEKMESGLTGKWSNFRGESLDNIVKTADPVKVPAEDYPVLWQVERVTPPRRSTTGGSISWIISRT